MSRRSRIILVAVVLALAVGGEVAVRYARGARGNVQVVNAGAEPLEGLVVAFGGGKVAVGRLPAGDSARIRLEGDSPGPIELEFAQRGNPLNSLRVEDYDPRESNGKGVRTVIEIRPGEVSKYMEDDDTLTPAGRIRDRILEWFGIEHGLAP
ncbi:hypothetical protein OJF2_71020 [Aquisphaera giovannonii]|uniref:Uncharacterized protein n=1 Tax=Aquisphaera giovannonii TaxID=406548 RepID=A0A5B9WE49_9BACT|nr:hypothetical protein [Aquisphaera giovannonii]QEH38499.1 hypothetical protein OJF2_71020 [Aquisphaera giovannonii]